jgi:hypothetical protein
MIKSVLLKAAGLISLAVFSAALPFVGTAYAAEGARLSPSLIELNAQPGGTYKLTIQVTDVTPGDQAYTVSTEDFSAKNETGSPAVFIDPKLTPQVSVRSWISAVPSFQLGSQQSKTEIFNVTVPANAEPGGHYGVIEFSGTTPQLNGTGVSLSATTGTLLLVTVAGDIKEDATMASFYTANGSRETDFFENAPVDFVTRVQNTGNIHLKPVGSIIVKNMFGSTVATLPVNADHNNVLPNSIRRFDTTYGKYMIGPYTATVTLGYGTQGHAITATATFWVVPYRLIAAIIIVLILIIFIIRRIQKTYNKRVIKKFQKAQKDDTKKSKH